MQLRSLRRTFLGNAIEILNRPNSAHAALQNGLHPFSLRGNGNMTAPKYNTGSFFSYPYLTPSCEINNM